MRPTKRDLNLWDSGSLQKEQRLFVPVPANLLDRYTAPRTHPAEQTLEACLQSIPSFITRTPYKLHLPAPALLRRARLRPTRPYP